MACPKPDDSAAREREAAPSPGLEDAAVQPTAECANGVAVVADGIQLADEGPQFLKKPREELCALLLAFLKQAYIADQEAAVRKMLRDISAGGPDPRPLGRWGLVTFPEVGEAVAAFEVWKEDGCPAMPAWYDSQTHCTAIHCFVVQGNSDETVDLAEKPIMDTVGSQFQRRNADRKLVRPRHMPGWFVPERNPAMPASAQPEKEKIWRIAFDFLGAEWGTEYLVLGVGDQVTKEHEEMGWAFGQVVMRQVPLPASTPGSTLSKGWYPVNFAEER